MPLTVFSSYAVLAGSAQDTDQRFELNPEALRLDISVFDQSLYISFSYDLQHFTQPREIQAGVIMSLDIKVRALLIRNKTAASVGRYNIIAWSSPIEITGDKYVRQL